MSDLIDRAAAIDAIKAASKEIQHWLWEAEGCEGYCAMVADVETCLDDLPSAQPEIIHCRDCIHIDPVSVRSGSLYCTKIKRYMTENDFCSFAERRTDEQ